MVAWKRGRTGLAAAAAIAALGFFAATHTTGRAVAQPEAPGAAARPDAKKPDFPPFAEVSKDFKQVSSTEGSTLYGVWTREKDGQMLLELPRGYENQRHFIALTVAGGETYAGLQVGDLYVYWKRFDKRMALMQPNVEVRSTGDAESKSSVQRIFTDRVILDVPIVSMGPSGQPVIDGDELLVGNANRFFGRQAGANTRLAMIADAKAFPENVVRAQNAAAGGQRARSTTRSPASPRTPGTSCVRPTHASATSRPVQRPGRLQARSGPQAAHQPLALEKVDSKLKMSPPKQPIVFLHRAHCPRATAATSARVLKWNKAFEKAGSSIMRSISRTRPEVHGQGP